MQLETGSTVVATANMVDLLRILDELTEKITRLEHQQRFLLSPAMTYTMNSGDTAWMLAATALVFMMTIPGLTLYYAGMAPKKQSLMTIAMQSFSITCLVTIAWLFFGYSLSFAPGSPVIGGYGRFFLVNLQVYQGHVLAPNIPEAIFCTFELGFAVIAAAIFSGASADRMKYFSMIVIVTLWHLLVYCPVAHSNWHEEGFLKAAGVLDFAGGNVVHIASGMSGLMSSFVIGKRHGFDVDKFTPNNVLHTITGACFLWIGWFGFNAGSAYGADEQSSLALMNTQIATATAAFSWILTEYFVTKLPTVLGMVNGAIAGLIAITPAAGFVDPTGSFIIGLLSGPVCYYGIRLKKYMGLDDALDAFGLHGIAGMYGGFMTGLFAKNFGAQGAFYGNPSQLGTQLYGIIVTALWSSVMTYFILLFTNKTIGIRISEDTEKHGLDRGSHGEGLYNERKPVTPSDRVAELLRAYAEAKKASSHGDARSDEALDHNHNTSHDHGNTRRTTPGNAGGGPAIGGSLMSEDSDLTSSDVEWMERNLASRKAEISMQKTVRGNRPTRPIEISTTSRGEKNTNAAQPKLGNGGGDDVAAIGEQGMSGGREVEGAETPPRSEGKSTPSKKKQQQQQQQANRKTASNNMLTSSNRAVSFQRKNTVTKDVALSSKDVTVSFPEKHETHKDVIPSTSTDINTTLPLPPTSSRPDTNGIEEQEL